MDSKTGRRAQAGTAVPRDDYRAVAVAADSPTKARDTEAGATADILPAVVIAWTGSTATTVCPPETPARPANATPAYRPRGTGPSTAYERLGPSNRPAQSPLGYRIIAARKQA